MNGLALTLKTIVTWIFTSNKMRRRALDSTGSRYGPAARSCEHGRESYGSTRKGEFFDSLYNCQVLGKGCGWRESTVGRAEKKNTHCVLHTTYAPFIPAGKTV
jgi:hypothetical protein